MVLNYYSILSKAIRGKDAAGRLSVYDEARAIVARLRVGPNHTEEDIAVQSGALESAISQIEADVAASYRAESGTERLDIGFGLLVCHCPGRAHGHRKRTRAVASVDTNQHRSRCGGS